MRDTDLGWAVPVMRAGYAGRGLVYLVVAGFALFAIWRGGSPDGTGSALQSLEGTPGGQIVLGLIVAGLFAYAVWRVIDAIWDLEDYGNDGEGLVARAGMAVTAVVHAGLGAAALAVLISSAGSSGGGESTIAQWTGKVMALPLGRILVGIGGAATVGAGIYYLVKAVREKYREHLKATAVTRTWNWILKAGVLSQAVIVGMIGGFLVYAALTANPDQAGGMKQVFDWLGRAPFGKVLVTAISVGLACFAAFCFLNAAYRTVPKIEHGDIETLAGKAKRAA